MYIENYTDN